MFVLRGRVRRLTRKMLKGKIRATNIGWDGRHSMQRALVSETGGKGVPEGTFLFARGYLEKNPMLFYQYSSEVIGSSVEESEQKPRRFNCHLTWFLTWHGCW
jgi:hypothetical protein